MNKKTNSIILFNKKQVRRRWDEGWELWYFSVVDVIEILTESAKIKMKFIIFNFKTYEKF